MQKQYTQKCKYFAQGRCMYGQKCRFSHQGFRQLYIMRHAQSIFNSLCDKLQGDSFTSEKAKIQFQLNPDIIDCGITQKGKQQAINVQLPEDAFRLKRKKTIEEVIKVKYIDLIFVSPLNRALQTAQIVLKKNKIKFKKIIVLPELTEVLSKVCDFSESIQKKKQKYAHYDFGQLDKIEEQIKMKKSNIFWQDSLLDDHYSHYLLDKQSRQQSHGKRYMKILQKIFPTPLQSSDRCFERTMLALFRIQQISKREQAKKVLIISHNRILKYMYGRQNNGRAASFQNCQIRKILLQNL